MYIPKWSRGLLPVTVKMITAKAPKRQNQLPPDNHGSVGEIRISKFLRKTGLLVARRKLSRDSNLIKTLSRSNVTDPFQEIPSFEFALLEATLVPTVGHVGE